MARLGSSVEVLEVDTPQGRGRLHVNRCRTFPESLVVLGHGAGGGVEAPDLLVLADVLPRHGIDVVRIEQPWRVAGRKVAPRPAQLDQAWEVMVAQVEDMRSNVGSLVVGGRSAGARVACRTAGRTGASAVLALAFPLHPPGKPERSRRGELPDHLPTLILQGDRDVFGGPADFGPVAKNWQLIGIPGGDHSLSVWRSAPITKREALQYVAEQTLHWLRSLSPSGIAAGVTTLRSP